MPAKPLLAGVPIRSPSHWVVLGLVIEQTGHAYEIADRYERRCALVLRPTTKNAVYNALDRLVSHGLSAERRAPYGRSRQIRTIYEATATGRAAHERWLQAPVTSGDWNEELIARLLTGHLLGRRGLLDLVDLYERTASAQIQRAEQTPTSPTEGQHLLSTLATRLVIQEQLQVAHARLAWIRAARLQLQEATA